VNVLYVTFNERLLSGLLWTQVFTLLGTIKSVTSGTHSITCVSYVSFLELAKNRARVVDLRATLRQLGVDLVIIPIPTIYGRLFAPRAWNIVFYVCYGLPVLLWFCWRRKADIVHGRSYMASLLAGVASRLLGCAWIFDMRSLYPEENIGLGTWAVESLDYRMWKSLEQWLLKNASAIVGVCDAFLDMFKEYASRFHVIPCCVDTRVFHCADASLRSSLRAELGIDGDAIVVVYTGSLGGWNDAGTIGKYFRALVELDTRLHCLIVTPEIRSCDYGYFRELVDRHRCSLYVSPTRPVQQYLCASDIAIHVMPPWLDSKTRLGVKFVEYVSSGLPVLVNSHVGAAAGFVRGHQVGVVLDLESLGETEAIIGFLASFEEMRWRCRALAESEFSTVTCAARYSELYTSVCPHMSAKVAASGH